MCKLNQDSLVHKNQQNSAGLIMQIKSKQALRSKLSDHLVEILPDDKLRFNNVNIKHVLSIDKEILNLLKLKKDISSMIGYNAGLDF